MQQWVSRELRVLDFDTECRPMHYSEFRSEDQLTAIAWSWFGSDDVEARVLEQDESNEAQMLDDFLAAYNEAEIVVGHYLTKHDLPLLNEQCLRLGRPLLKPIRVLDTFRITKTKGLGKSQENLSATFGVGDEKHRMCGHSWRVANSLSPSGRAGALTRVTSDVRQNKALRERLLEIGALQPPTLWHP